MIDTRAPSTQPPGTCSPTEWTVPEASWPRVSGGTAGSGISPWMKCKSEAQMPLACTLTTTSIGPGVGSGTS